MKKLEQIRTANGQIFPSPRDGETMYETPPTLCWLREGKESYRIVVKQGENVVWQGETERNFIVPDLILTPGGYEWNLYAGRPPEALILCRGYPGNCTHARIGAGDAEAQYCRRA